MAVIVHRKIEHGIISHRLEPEYWWEHFWIKVSSNLESDPGLIAKLGRYKKVPGSYDLLYGRWTHATIGLVWITAFAFALRKAWYGAARLVWKAGYLEKKEAEMCPRFWLTRIRFQRMSDYRRPQ